MLHFLSRLLVRTAFLLVPPGSDSGKCEDRTALLLVRSLPLEEILDIVCTYFVAFVFLL